MSFNFKTILISIFISEIFARSYFCDYQCGDVHTACFREPCAPYIVTCGNIFKQLPFKHPNRIHILHLHNEFRSNTTYKRRYTVGDMNVMSYSRELEFVAQCWANSCLDRHDECRRTTKHKVVGQNIFIFKSSLTTLTLTDVINKAMRKWTTEKFPLKFLETFRPQTENENISQLMWAATYEVGCGAVRFGHREKVNYLLVCNYGPSGRNYMEKVFEKGKACNQCQCLSQYKNLCGKIQDYRGVDWEQPFVLQGVKKLVSPWVVILMLIATTLFPHFCFQATV